MKFLNALLGTIFYNSRRYDRLKRDEERRQNSNALGIWSLIYTVCGVIFSVLCIWAIGALLNKSSSMSSGGTLDTLLIIIGIFLLIVLLIELVFQLVINGLCCAIFQLKLNRKPIGFVALVVWLTLLIVAVIIIAVVVF